MDRRRNRDIAPYQCEGVQGSAGERPSLVIERHGEHALAVLGVGAVRYPYRNAAAIGAFQVVNRLGEREEWRAERCRLLLRQAPCCIAGCRLPEPPFNCGRPAVLEGAL